MSSRKKIKKRIKRIIDDECVIFKSKIKGSDFLDDDLELDNSDFRDIRDAINYEYGLSLRKRDIKGCVDVNDIVDLVYEELEENHLYEAEIRVQEYLSQMEDYARQSATESKSSFLKWLSSVGLSWITKTIFNWTWDKIIILFAL
ncbi:MAG: hypothetical protein QNJ65_20580 [Xenococcaceae cyanobacterium MO_234.B1]|nr:hypothetical protein [Xenococcaceae cyanobacterium MO_234.B1]